MTNETGIKPYGGEFAVLNDAASAFLDVLEENTGSRQFDLSMLPIYTYPGAGGEVWTHDSENGKETLPVITGVILGQRVSRTFYRDAYSGGGIAPDCQSNDGRTGHPAVDSDGQPVNLFFAPDATEVIYGGECARCPLEQWGSVSLVGKTGNGKACREQRVILIQQPDAAMPVIVRLPPSALMAWRDFGMTLARAGIGFSKLVIELKLALPKVKGATTPDLQPRVVGRIPSEVTVALKAIVPEMKRLQIAAPVEAAADLEGAEPF